MVSPYPSFPYLKQSLGQTFVYKILSHPKGKGPNEKIQMSH
jgi:hypothetical protein